MKHNDEEDIEYVSKTELKREMQRFHALAEQLCSLPVASWEKIPGTETLHGALRESRRIKKADARRRHFQFMGKILQDEEHEAIQHALDMLNPSSEAFGRRSGQLEQWRTRLIDDNDAMKSFLDEYPNVDRQQLRNMVRNAQKEMHSEPPKPGTSYKKLFQMIKEIVPAE
tara:strand:+ start:11602 stop:12111 length:510 start_codon:yes stop_codon:yes gene_type:complete